MSTITARTLAALVVAAPAAGWTVTDSGPQTIEFRRGDRLFIASHFDGGRFGAGYRLSSPTARDFVASYGTLRAFIAALNAA